VSAYSFPEYTAGFMKLDRFLPD